MKITVVLVILDGWGIGQDNLYNPIYTAQLKTIAYLENHFPCGALQASGIAVGLPWGEEGNSEVGHLTIGAGKTIYQHLPRINIAIEKGAFFKNEVLLRAFAHVRQHQNAVHLIGILSQGNVHASINHLQALIKMAHDQNIEAINLHVFADGKDSPKKSVLELLRQVAGTRVASFAGRYYAMDRDKHWDRTQLSYQALMGKTTMINDLETFIKEQYRKGLSDEYLQPVAVGPENRGIKDGDAVVFFNFREDSIRQIAEPFLHAAFNHFPTTPLRDIFVATMTTYFDDYRENVIAPPEIVGNSLGKIIADSGKTQLRIAETEKYAHVTYFFNGLKDAPLANEYRVLIPSRSIAHPDEHPEMMAQEITTRIVQSLEDREMNFILANYANPDIIAHTGNYEAAVQAVRVIDQELEKLVKATLAQEAALIITSDHGNIEQMVNPRTGLPEAKHNTSPVPLYIVARELERTKNPQERQRIKEEAVGFLADVAPTVLEIMKLPQPPDMTGQSLLKRL